MTHQVAPVTKNTMNAPASTALDNVLSSLPPSATSFSAITPLIRSLLNSPSTYSFTPLLINPLLLSSVAAAEASSGADSKAFLSAHRSLVIFDSGSVLSWQSDESLPPLAPLMRRKLEILSLVRLVISSGGVPLPYSLISTECLFQSEGSTASIRNVEDLIIEMVGLTLGGGEIDQKKAEFVPVSLSQGQKGNISPWYLLFLTLRTLL